MSQQKRTVAIVGTGIAGETAVYMLQKYCPSVTVEAVFEVYDRPGLHHNSIVIDGRHVDVPLRAVSPHYYPNLFQLYKELDVELIPVNYGNCGSVWEESGKTKPFFKYDNVLKWGLALPYIKGNEFKSLFFFGTAFMILRDLLWFVFTGPFYLLWGFTIGSQKSPSLGTFLRAHNCSSQFIDLFMYPICSTMLSCTTDQVDKYPARLITEFFSSRCTTVLTGWFRVADGVQLISKKLLKDVDPSIIHFNCGVKRVESVGENGIGVVVVDQQGKMHRFDYVIIATEPGVARKIWCNKVADELSMLDLMDEYRAEIMVHTDPNLMPSDKADWCGMQYFTPSKAKEESGLQCFKASMTTAVLNQYHPSLRDAKETYFETWNPFAVPNEKNIVSRAAISRGVWTVEGLHRYNQIFERIQGARGIFLCGAYTVPGMTLLEQAATSSMLVAKKLGGKLPFKLKKAYEPYWWTLLLAHVIFIFCFMWRLWFSVVFFFPKLILGAPWRLAKRFFFVKDKTA